MKKYMLTTIVITVIIGLGLLLTAVFTPGLTITKQQSLSAKQSITNSRFSTTGTENIKPVTFKMMGHGAIITLKTVVTISCCDNNGVTAVGVHKTVIKKHATKKIVTGVCVTKLCREKEPAKSCHSISKRKRTRD